MAVQRESASADNFGILRTLRSWMSALPTTCHLGSTYRGVFYVPFPCSARVVMHDKRRPCPLSAQPRVSPLASFIGT